MVGRALRKGEAKSVATIIDITDNWKKHGLPDDNYQWSLEAIPPATRHIGLRKCEFCSHIFRPLEHELKLIRYPLKLLGIYTKKEKLDTKTD
ncbi:hypothetical protein ACE1CI_22235 [Aerosakkonemataceae cyanobacterium BLCC-F50]|uniref:Uncharacterized protein n=1 Tax=Floridaenema flaviceps BLCC-F50 TaxID=3153642 RepID=A0ABV4XV78_9CYAN